MKINPYVVFLAVYGFSSHIGHSFILSWFLYKVWGRDITSFFCMWKSSYTLLFAKETDLSPLNGFGTLVKSQLALYVWVYFRTLNSNPLAYLFVLKPVAHCFDFCRFVEKFQIRRCEYSDFVSLQDHFSYSQPRAIPSEFEVCNNNKEESWKFVRESIEPVAHLVDYCYLNNFKSSSDEDGCLSIYLGLL